MPTHPSAAPRVALVTGAGSGIGKAVAIALNKEGYAVVLAGRRAGPLDETASQLSPGGGADTERPDRRPRRRVGPCALREDLGRLRQAGPPVQQRRRQRPGRAARGAPGGAVGSCRRHQPDRRVSLHAAGDTADEAPDPERRTHHQQRLDLGVRPAARLGAVHRDQARDHRPDQIDVARRPEARHRLRPDRHRQRRDRDGRENGARACLRPTDRLPSSR